MKFMCILDCIRKKKGEKCFLCCKSNPLQNTSNFTQQDVSLSNTLNDWGAEFMCNETHYFLLPFTLWYVLESIINKL